MTVVLVTDPRYAPERIEEVVRVVSAALGGRFIVQLRDKAAPLDAVCALAKRLQPALAGARLVVNCTSIATTSLSTLAASGIDSVHVACSADAIARARERFAWVSVPVHDDAALVTAAAADAMLVSPIFDTPGKGPARGTAALRCAAAHEAAHVFALGGITPENAPECAAAGARGVAAIRALLDAVDPESVARALEAPFR